MKKAGILLAALFLQVSCVQSQEKEVAEPHLVGGPCEGCEAILEYGDQNLNAVDTLPEFEEAEKKLKVQGTIFQADGKTPAEGVVLYIHHTNTAGIYPTRGDETGWGRRHGYLRGWVKTGKDGKYTFYTQVPGTYPSRDAPAHIHPYILEPNGKYYWLGSYFFEDDPLLDAETIDENHRGGSSGVVKLQKEENYFVINRDFVLGKNIPDYD
ncbi:dioxygenase family protein [Salinimicrobium soli]|uniref:dioxygenase family protein n=1 Tax=Salinimicrobium soli TaxID=1254399 RepID=UPI003AB0E7D7